MANYLKRLAEYYEESGTDYLVLSDTLWTLYQRMIEPMGPVCRDFRISPVEEEKILAHFPKGFLLRYTDGFQAGDVASNDLSKEPPSTPWFAVICDQFVGFEEFNSHFRNKLRKSMKLCTVRKVDAEYIAGVPSTVMAEATLE